MTTNYGQNVYSQSSGTASTILFDAVRQPRIPSPSDYNYPLGKFWVNTTNDAVYYYASQYTTDNQLQAMWVIVASGSLAAGVDTINHINPDGTGNFTLESTDASILITPVVNGLDLTVTGGSQIETITGNSGGPQMAIANNFDLLGAGSITTVGTPGTETIELVGLTNHAVLVGAGTSTITNVIDIAASGIPLISQTGADPTFGTALVPGGGTGATTLTGVLIGNGTSPVTGNPVTQYNVLVGGASNAITSVPPSVTLGYVLTSNGSTANPTFQAIPEIMTIDGDVGSASGNTITIYANQAAINSGSSVNFVNSGATSTFNVTDSHFNTMIGAQCGNATITGSNNTALGYQCSVALTSGINNVCIGWQAGVDLTSGGSNTIIGPMAGSFLTSGSGNVLIDGGSAYTSSETNNICIQNIGVTGESAVTRIGNLSQTQCYIGGIKGVTVSNAEFVTINSVTAQMGVISGGSIGQTITGNSGGAISPSAGNWNTLGTGSITIVGSGSTLTTELTGLTNHAVQVGAGTATLTQLTVGTNGQVLVGASAADPAFATLTSSDGSISFTTGANTLSLQVSGGTTAIKTITGNSGGAESPSAGNFNILGTGSITVAGSANTETVQLTGLTNHAIQIGAGTATLTQLSAGSTGQVLQTNTTADPTWSTATYPSIATGRNNSSRRRH